jgi:hydrogenase 3 maturation protease
MLKVAIVGIGNELKGDDAAGVLVARRLSHIKEFLVLEGGSSPENLMPTLKKFAPSWIIFIDSTDFGGKPGEVRLFNPLRASGIPVSTHVLPLSLMAKYLEIEIEAKVLLIGIQPKSLEGPISQEVRQGVERVSSWLMRAAQLMSLIQDEQLKINQLYRR